MSDINPVGSASPLLTSYGGEPGADNISDPQHLLLDRGQRTSGDKHATGGVSDPHHLLAPPAADGVDNVSDPQGLLAPAGPDLVENVSDPHGLLALPTAGNVSDRHHLLARTAANNIYDPHQLLARRKGDGADKVSDPQHLLASPFQDAPGGISFRPAREPSPAQEPIFRRELTASDHLRDAAVDAGNLAGDLWEKDYGEIVQDAGQLLIDTSSALYRALFGPDKPGSSGEPATLLADGSPDGR